MTLSVKIIFFLFLPIFLLSPFQKLYSQDIYDYNHSLEFANYLLQSQQYNYAAEEFERLLFMKPEKDTVKYLLLKSYRMGGKLETGIRKTHALYSDISSIPPSSGKEYLRMLVMQGNFIQSSYFIRQNNLISDDEKNVMRLNIELLQNNYDSAVAILNRYEQSFSQLEKEKYSLLIKQGYDLPHKSAGLALAMSTVIPGAGRFYTGDWKDGIISLVMVGVTGYQAYNGFSNEDSNNAVAWIYAGIGAGFYLGNIYGSYKSAKNYNRKALHQYEHQVRDFVFSSF